MADTIGVMHDQRRKFDAEDGRLLTGLASDDLSVPYNSPVSLIAPWLGSG